MICLRGMVSFIRWIKCWILGRRRNERRREIKVGKVGKNGSPNGWKRIETFFFSLPKRTLPGFSSGLLPHTSFHCLHIVFVACTSICQQKCGPQCINVIEFAKKVD